MEKKNLIGQIHNSMYQNVKSKGWVAPVDVLVDIGVLSQQSLEDWRFEKVPFLEKVCQVNLHKLSGIMKEIRAYASKNKLKASWTFYHQYGKNDKRKLRFSKYGDEKVEYHYATHYVDVNRIAELKKPAEADKSEK